MGVESEIESTSMTLAEGGKDSEFSVLEVALVCDIQLVQAYFGFGCEECRQRGCFDFSSNGRSLLVCFGVSIFFSIDVLLPVVVSCKSNMDRL